MPASQLCRRAPAIESHRARTFLARGRSGVVFRVGSDESHAAIKVFRPDALMQGALTIVLGAPNPYRWSASAARCAVYRRRILGTLVKYWFGDRLRIPRTTGPRWNPEERAFEIRMEYIRSSHLPLVRGARGERDQLDDLVRNIMRPLQLRLLECGAVGMVWQAGMGNPVAGGNFMLEPGPNGHVRWVWVDLESGIPPLVPMNVLTLFRFYLPQMMRRRRIMFDDVDVDTLRRYVARHRNALVRQVGDTVVARLERDVDRLSQAQPDWLELSRLDRGVTHAVAVGMIDSAQAAWYGNRPIRWLGRQIGWGISGLHRVVAAGASRLLRWARRRPWRRYVAAVVRFVSSGSYRARLARRYVHGRLLAWHSRRFVDGAELRELRRALVAGRAATDIGDFSVHLAMKAPVSAVQYWILPALFLAGVVDPVVLGMGVLLLESAVRTAYTGGRVIACIATGQSAPWIALLVGTFPVVGVAAYPVQMLHSAANNERALPRFIVCDTFASIGRAIPVWGGKDSLVEHRFNRLGSRAVTVTEWARRDRMTPSARSALSVPAPAVQPEPVRRIPPNNVS